jgi:hypothetical protein
MSAPPTVESRPLKAPPRRILRLGQLPALVLVLVVLGVLLLAAVLIETVGALIGSAFAIGFVLVTTGILVVLVPILFVRTWREQKHNRH